MVEPSLPLFLPFFDTDIKSNNFMSFGQSSFKEKFINKKEGILISPHCRRSAAPHPFVQI